MRKRFLHLNLISSTNNSKGQSRALFARVLVFERGLQIISPLLFLRVRCTHTTCIFFRRTLSLCSSLCRDAVSCVFGRNNRDGIMSTCCLQGLYLDLYLETTKIFRTWAQDFSLLLSTFYISPPTSPIF